ncbi:MAG: PD-(D/E)XK nuclease family protein [Promethearchaeota archaeon]
MFNDFNLSKTEFKAYLECPLKFYLIKSQNYNLPLGPRGRRDYSQFSSEKQEGMYWHYWFMDFYKTYKEDIKTGAPAPTDELPHKTFIMTAFYQLELKRFRDNPHFWCPLATELYLQSEYYRGTLDRIDLLNTQGDSRVVEYKARPGVFDRDELLFYALLLSQKLADEELLQSVTAVKEIAVYYYRLGEFQAERITLKDLQLFEQRLQTIIEEIFQPNWVRKEGCDGHNKDCSYSCICKNIPL